MRNQVRGCASIDLPKEKFETGLWFTTISESRGTISSTPLAFEGGKEKKVLAILARSVIFMFGTNALDVPALSERGTKGSTLVMFAGACLMLRTNLCM